MHAVDTAWCKGWIDPDGRDVGAALASDGNRQRG
jgi:hypothetical protein